VPLEIWVGSGIRDPEKLIPDLLIRDPGYTTLNLVGLCHEIKSFVLFSGGSHLSEREPLDQKPNIQFTDSTVLSHLQL
jgi:hypothetical protein